jgi:hypothetical protein
VRIDFLLKTIKIKKSLRGKTIKELKEIIIDLASGNNKKFVKKRDGFKCVFCRDNEDLKFNK